MEEITKNLIEEAPEDELIDILGVCYKSLAKLCKVLFPERFRLEFTRSHEMMFEVLDDTSIQKVVIAAPRGIGKTSIVGLGLMARNILFRDCHFIPYVSKTETHAITQTENLKRKLLTSPDIRHLFGSIKTRAYIDMDETFSKKSWVASLPSSDGFKTLVLPRGVGQQVRGLLFEDFRPDLFQIDDLEDDSFIGNPEYRRKTKDWFFGPLMGAVSQAEEDYVRWRVIYTDTIKHHDSLVEVLLSSSDWEGLRLSICDENYKTLVPGFKSTHAIRQMVDQYREKGQLDTFAREYMCQPISRESAAFKPELFKSYTETGTAFLKQKENIRSVVIFDPSRTYSGNKTGMVCWGVNVETDAMFLREAVAERWAPEQQVNEAFNMAIRNKSHIVAYENTGLNDWAEHVIRSQMVQRGLHFDIIGVKALMPKKSGVEGIDLREEDGKAGRCAMLLNFYRRGLIYHNVTCQHVEVSLMGWPRPKEWDILDAMSYIVPIMEEYTMYFLPHGSDGNEYEYEDEYVGLTDSGDNKPNEATDYFV